MSLHVTVVDKDRKMVTNLDKDSFSVLENGKVQPIKSFRHEDIPVAMGIVIDNSGSMRDKREKVGKAALNLVKSSNPNDEVFVVNFNDDYYLDQDFTSDIKKLKEALDKIDTKGGTALYDAIMAAWDSELKNAKRFFSSSGCKIRSRPWGMIETLEGIMPSSSISERGIRMVVRSPVVK